MPTKEQNDIAVDNHAPRNLTFAENLKLTIKILVIGALVFGAIWGVKLFTSPK